MKRIIRDRHLTEQEAAAYQAIRDSIAVLVWSDGSKTVTTWDVIERYKALYGHYPNALQLTRKQQHET